MMGAITTNLQEPTVYCPTHFTETRPEVLHGLIVAHPLGTLITHDHDGLNADHIPLHLIQHHGDRIRLVGHVARSNPVWQQADSTEVLVVFQGPQTYVSPNWYASKADHGRAVPTWNYAVVHAHGRLRAIDDPAWVHAQLDALTTQHEATQPHPWALSDAPADFTARLMGQIVGIEIDVTRLQGKWKVSQNQPTGNQASVVAGLRGTGRAADADMANLVALHTQAASGG